MGAGHADYLETEAKLWAEDLEAIRDRLLTLGAECIQPRVFEHNIRYEDAAGTLTAQGIVLRLRQDDHARLTYKGPMLGTASDPVLDAARRGLQSRFEAEVTVDDFATMDLILRRLGYSPFMTYEKYRATYRLGTVEIMLDEMPYGHFVEVEGDPDGIEQTILALRLTNCRRFLESYAVLFHHVRANLGLVFTDLTFANFAGITVPLTAFDLPGGEQSDYERAK